MPLFDFYCPICHEYKERLCKDSHTMLYCSCGEVMLRLLSYPGGFQVKGANAQNGYTTKKEK